jgi:hypothetical protein
VFIDEVTATGRLVIEENRPLIERLALTRKHFENWFLLEIYRRLSYRADAAALRSMGTGADWPGMVGRAQGLRDKLRLDQSEGDHPGNFFHR